MGKEMCLAFAEYGAAGIVIASRKVGNCEELAKVIQAKWPKCECLPHAVNVNDWKGCDGLYEATIGKFGRCDVLVNNAGGSPLYPSLLDITEDYFDKVVGLNLKGPFRLSALFGAKMCTQPEGGSIINVSSIESLRPNWRAAVYAASKSGVNYLTKAIANAYGPKVRCNCILPGAFLTDISKAWDIPSMEPIWKKTVPLSRAGEAGEIVGATLYFASKASSFTTGSILEVTGGSIGSDGMRDPRSDGTMGMGPLPKL